MHMDFKGYRHEFGEDVAVVFSAMPVYALTMAGACNESNDSASNLPILQTVCIASTKAQHLARLSSPRLEISRGPFILGLQSANKLNLSSSTWVG